MFFPEISVAIASKMSNASQYPEYWGKKVFIHHSIYTVLNTARAKTL